MDSVTHYDEDWTYLEDRSPLKQMFSQDPNVHTGKWILSQEEYGQRQGLYPQITIVSQS